MADIFVWHELSEKDRQDIEKNAKKVLDNFANALKQVDESSEEANVEREEFSRKENNKECEADSEFRDIMFENAPIKKGDFIKAEKKKW